MADPRGLNALADANKRAAMTALIILYAEDCSGDIERVREIAGTRNSWNTLKG